MRKLAMAGALLVLALAAQGCGDNDNGSPTEPAGRPARGNWIGTISGTHTAIRLQGTCELEMQLVPNLSSGLWWIDCPNGASSQGQVIGVAEDSLAVLVLFPLTPPLDCPFELVGTRTTVTIDGDFDVLDCDTNGVRSTGTFSLRLR